MYHDHGWCVLVNRITIFYPTHAKIDAHSTLCLVRTRLIPPHCATELHNHHDYQNFSWPIQQTRMANSNGRADHSAFIHGRDASIFNLISVSCWHRFTVSLRPPPTRIGESACGYFISPTQMNIKNKKVALHMVRKSLGLALVRPSVRNASGNTHARIAAHRKRVGGFGPRPARPVMQ